MSSPGTITIPDEIKQIFTTLVTNVGLGVAKIEKADVQAAATSLQSTKTLTNLGAQILLLQTKAVLNEPQDESVAVNQLGVALSSLANLLPG